MGKSVSKFYDEIKSQLPSNQQQILQVLLKAYADFKEKINTAKSDAMKKVFEKPYKNFIDFCAKLHAEKPEFIPAEILQELFTEKHVCQARPY